MGGYRLACFVGTLTAGRCTTCPFTDRETAAAAEIDPRSVTESCAVEVGEGVGFAWGRILRKRTITAVAAGEKDGLSE